MPGGPVTVESTPVEIVLVHPEIPHNTGCVARLAAATGLRLHLVAPLGFSLEDRYLKRAGLDYWPMVDLVVHPDWQALVDSVSGPSAGSIERRLRLFSARGGRSLFDVPFAEDDLLCFGSESKGLPHELLAGNEERRVYVPIRTGVRSLNLASVVCLSAYTAMRAAAVPLPSNAGGYEAHPLLGERLRPSDMAR